MTYDDQLEALQLALVRTQQAALASGERTVLVLEGRDGAGKDGAIKRIIEHLAARATRVVALPKPSDRERTQWYFQRYVAHLPAAGELVIFNRSWYNRAGVEVVMGFLHPRTAGGVPARRARLRADAGRERHPAGEALARHLEAGTAQTARRAADRSAQGAEGQRHGRSRTGEMGRLLRRSGHDDDADQLGHRAVVLRARRRQEGGPARDHPPPAAKHRAGGDRGGGGGA
jgi:hypothetical protein